MENNKIKNTIVLRGMASNLVDEAIVILKPHVKLRKIQTIKNVKEKNYSKEMILKEAENIVTEYVEKISTEQLKSEKIKLEKRIKKLKLMLFSFFIFLLVILIIK